MTAIATATAFVGFGLWTAAPAYADTWTYVYPCVSGNPSTAGTCVAYDKTNQQIGGGLFNNSNFNYGSVHLFIWGPTNHPLNEFTYTTPNFTIGPNQVRFFASGYHYTPGDTWCVQLYQGSWAREHTCGAPPT